MTSPLFKQLVRSVYPILVREDTGNAFRITYRGTGFVTEVAGRIVLITVYHIGFKPHENPKQWLILPEWTDTQEEHSVLLEGEFSAFEPDISAFVFSEKTRNSFVHAPVPLSIIQRELEPLEDVFVFGFPFTDIRIEYDPVNGVVQNDARIQSLFLKGYIARRISSTNLATHVPNAFPLNYVLSFPAYPGISGSPLLVNEGGGIHACGLVYGNQKTSFLRGPIEVDVDGETGTKSELYAEYDFGLSSNHDPLRAVVEQLEKVIR